MRGRRVVGGALLVLPLLGTAAVVPGEPVPPRGGAADASVARAVGAQDQAAVRFSAGPTSLTARTVATSPKPRKNTKGDVAEPAPLNPVATEPVAEPVVSEPVMSEPVEAEPAVTEPAATPTTSTTEPDPAVEVRRTVPLGVTVPWGPLDPDALAATTAATGVPPSHLQWYTGFGEAPDVTKLQAVVDAGAVPVVTWEPWVWTDGVDQPRWSLATFTRGDHDAYLRQWADALAAWDRPVMVRFAHEMNGSWYPWAAGVNGNTAEQYVAAWRHVHDLFAAHGAHRVQWVWAPNVVYPGSTPLTSLYPGDAYVDVVGVDGYNWGTTRTWESWRSPAQVFDATLAELRTVAPGKPLLITETASTELGGDKAAWVTDLFTWAAAQPDLTGVIWFDEDKETDWRISSSAESEAAFRGALVPVP